MRRVEHGGVRSRAEAKDMGRPVLAELMQERHEGRSMAQWIREKHRPAQPREPDISPAAADAMRRFQTGLLERLGRKRPIATPAVTVQCTGKAKQAIDRASTRFPDDWTRLADTMGRLHLLYSQERGGYFSFTADHKAVRVPGMGVFHEVRRGDAAIKTNLLAAAEHEYAHRLQHALPELDRFFQEEHRARTAGESLKRLNDLQPKLNYQMHEVAREDNYYNPYQGREYDGDNPALEVMTMTFEPLLGEMDDRNWNAKRLRDILLKDPDMVRLGLGLLFYWRPGG